MSLQAYQQAAKRAEQPRDSEYRLFGEVTRALMAASATGPEDFSTRIDALDWNRRVWMALAADCAKPTNTLSPDLRAQIISLSLWVGRHSSAIMRGEETFDALIEVNRIMMQGLGARVAA
jgi:flagellar protein FlaF